MKNLKTTLGKRIREFRNSKGLTQEKLGETSGVSYKFIGEIERGEVNPSLESLSKISSALGVTLCDFFPSKNDLNSLYSIQEIQKIKEALKLLGKVFS